VSGLGRIQVDEAKLVRKWGRKTGVTEAAVQLVYSHVRLPGINGETSEYPVTTGQFFSYGAGFGGPVLDTANRLVGMVLGGTDGTPKRVGGSRTTRKRVLFIYYPIQLILARVEEVAG
jgi:hypothetical protein